MSTATLNQETLRRLVEFVAGTATIAAQQRSAAKQAAITAQAQVEVAEIHAEIRALEIAADREQSRQKAAILSKIIAAWQHIEDRKFDLVLEAFRATHELLLQQQQALIDEKRSLSAQKAEIPSSEIRRMIFIRKREGEIAAELSDIRRHASLLQLKVQFFCEQHNMIFRLPALPLV